MDMRESVMSKGGRAGVTTPGPGPRRGPGRKCLRLNNVYWPLRSLKFFQLQSRLK